MSKEGRFFTTLGQDVPTFVPGGIRNDGEDVDNTTAGTTAAIIVYQRDRDGDILMATGTDVPADTTVGYAAGCMFIDRNVAAGTAKNYLNQGSAATAEFSLVTQAA